MTKYQIRGTLPNPYGRGCSVPRLKPSFGFNLSKENKVGLELGRHPEGAFQRGRFLWQRENEPTEEGTTTRAARAPLVRMAANDFHPKAEAIPRRM